MGAEMECSTQGGKTQEARPPGEVKLRWVQTRGRDHQKGLGREGESMDKQQVKNQEFGLGFLEGLETVGGWVERPTSDIWCQGHQGNWDILYCNWDTFYLRDLS